MRQLVSQRFLDHAEHRALEPGTFDRLVDDVAGAVLDPYTAADRILDLAARGGTQRCTESGEAPA